MANILLNILIKLVKNNPQLLEDIIVEGTKWIAAEIKKANEDRLKNEAMLNKVVDPITWNK